MNSLKHPQTKKVFLSYNVPKSLKQLTDIPLTRKIDSGLLDKELMGRNSSLNEKISSGIIWRMKFPGMILDVKKINELKDLIELVVSPAHPHRADLAYKRDKTLQKNVCPLTITSILQTKERGYVLGIRGGSVEFGKIGVIPGGHAEYKFPLIKNTLETFKAEFEEEIGYKFGDDKNVFLLGVFKNRDTKGINVLYFAKTNLIFPEILKKWKKAKDRDEHSSLFLATKKDLVKLAKTGKLIVDGKEYLTTPFFQDCFKLAIKRKIFTENGEVK